MNSILRYWILGCLAVESFFECFHCVWGLGVPLHQLRRFASENDLFSHFTRSHMHCRVALAQVPQLRPGPRNLFDLKGPKKNIAIKNEKLDECQSCDQTRKTAVSLKAGLQLVLLDFFL